MNRTIVLILLIFSFASLSAEDGSRLWLSKSTGTGVMVDGYNKGQLTATARKELQQHWRLGNKVVFGLRKDIKDEGYSISVSRMPKSGKLTARIEASSERGFLYGAFDLLRWQERQGTGDQDLPKVQQVNRRAKGQSDEKYVWQSHPHFALRLLNHWDNLDGSIERGYAGRSIFWNSPVSRGQWAERIRLYARANASIGINGSVLNNVNASPKMLTAAYIDSLRQIADLLRPYGIKTYISVNFGSPKALGATTTADPLDAQVIAWWKSKVKEIYAAVPDFGGFLVKANSEGQPGPFDYGRSHADGANMLADALKPYGGIVMWRSFVYGSKHKGEDRVKQAVSEFKELDGSFRDNVILQSKNGPLDFQPREPYAPIFDNMPQTHQAVEFQITQEYTGQAKHLVFLAPMWKEFFSFVSPDSVITASGGAKMASHRLLEGMAGVSNIGDDANWCGHEFSQANWYALGRLAWNPHLSSEQIAREWLEQTFTCDRQFVDAMQKVMLSSREACVDYMMPLGLHHIFKFDHHYGPEPDGFKAEYPIEWCPVYYHKADSLGIGFDRTQATGSGATAQYREPYRSLYDNLQTCPDEYLLWFHHLPWNYRMRDGSTLWQSMQKHYQRGVDQVEGYRQVWQQMRPYIDAERWQHVDSLLNVQIENAKEWRDTCLTYFGSFVPRH
jgi:alpha-glucuronidase